MKKICFMRWLLFIVFFSIYSVLSFATLPRSKDNSVNARVSDVLKILFPRLVHHLLPSYKSIKNEIEKNYYEIFNLWVNKSQGSYSDSDIETLNAIEEFANNNRISECCDTFEERVINYVKYYRERNGKRPVTLTKGDLEGF